MFSKRSYARIRMAVCPRALSVGSAILFVFLGLVYSTTAAPLAIQHVVDFNGDGRTDISVVRNVNGSIVWFNYDGVSIPPAGITYNYFGLAATDFLTPADYDGDGKTDIAV